MKHEPADSLINSTAGFYAELFSMLSYGTRPVIKRVIGYPVKSICEKMSLSLDEFKNILCRLADIDCFDKISFAYINERNKLEHTDIDIDPVNNMPITQKERRAFRDYLLTIKTEKEADIASGDRPWSRVLIHCYAENVDSFYGEDHVPSAYTIALPMTVPEFTKDAKESREGLPIIIKDAVWSEETNESDTEITGQKLYNCEKAIRQSKRLMIQLNDHALGSNTTRSLIVDPIKVVYDYFYESAWLLASSKDIIDASDPFRSIDTYPLDDISSARVLDRPVTAEFPKNLTFLDSLWGIDIHEKPVHVRVAFEHTGQVWDRVRNLLRAYVDDDEIEYNSEELDEYDSNKLLIRSGMLIYEDDIIGIKSFERYIRALGDSAYVITPEKLRNSLYKSAKTKEKEYSKAMALAKTTDAPYTVQYSRI